MADEMKISKYPIFIAAAIPIAGWLVSMPYNWWTMGDPFTASGEWNNLPLWIVTLPLNRIAEILFDKALFPDHPYSLILIYTALCSIIYVVIGAGLSMCLQYTIKKLK